MNRLQYILTLLFLIGQWAYAQDTLPIQPKPDRHSAPIYSSEEMTRLMEFIAVDNPMPEQFLQTTDNVLMDPTAFSVFLDEVEAVRPSGTDCAYRRFSCAWACLSVCDAPLSGR